MLEDLDLFVEGSIMADEYKAKKASLINKKNTSFRKSLRD